MPLDMCTQVSHSYVPVHCATAVGRSFDAPATDTTLFVALQESRVIKSEKELEVMRYMNQVTSEAHLAVMRNCAPGLAEYAMLGAVSGAQGRCSPTPVSNPSQVPNGGDLPALVLLPRWLALHVVHLHLCRGQQRCDASLRPRRRAERQEDRGRRDVFVRHGRRGACSACAVWSLAPLVVLTLLLCCQYHRYGSDVTCSFPANGKFTDAQKFIYETVLGENPLRWCAGLPIGSPEGMA